MSLNKIPQETKNKIADELHVASDRCEESGLYVAARMLRAFAVDLKSRDPKPGAPDYHRLTYLKLIAEYYADALGSALTVPDGHSVYEHTAQEVVAASLNMFIESVKPLDDNKS